MIALRLADHSGSVHTPIMSLKTAALLALVGMLLQTVILAAGFVATVWGLLSGVAPAMALLTALVHLLASLGVTLFLYVFHKGQSPA